MEKPSFFGKYEVDKEAEKDEAMDDNKAEMRERLPAEVYFVTSAADDTVLVGLNVELMEEENGDRKVQWFDTVKERAILVDGITKMDDTEIVFKREAKDGGGEYSFKPMTLETYEGSVKDKLMAASSFANQSDMEEAFKSTLRG